MSDDDQAFVRLFEGSRREEWIYSIVAPSGATAILPERPIDPNFTMSVAFHARSRGSCASTATVCSSLAGTSAFTANFSSFCVVDVHADALYLKVVSAGLHVTMAEQVATQVRIWQSCGKSRSPVEAYVAQMLGKCSGIREGVMDFRYFENSVFAPRG